MNMPTAPAKVDLDLNEALLNLDDETRKVTRKLARAYWLTPEEREDKMGEIIAEAIDARTDTGALDPVDGTLIRFGVDKVLEGVKRVRLLMLDIMDRSPEELREKADNAERRKNFERAARLRKEAADREARKGNG